MPLQIIRQDITQMCVDAIVNTTNREMIGYSGVDLAVHTAAGSRLDEECAKLPPLEPGQAVITGGYCLPCKYVIHTAGPIWRGGADGEDAVLRSCYLESLKLAVRTGCQTVAFPLISAGVYQFPKERVLKFAIQTITEFLLETELTVYLCVFDRESYSFSQKLFQDIRAFIDDAYVAEHGEEFSQAFDLQTVERRKRTDAVQKAPREALRKVDPQRCPPPLPPLAQAQAPAPVAAAQSLRDYVRQMDKSFQEMLFDLIDQSGMTDVECYKKANVDKRTFSKIKSNKDYRPSKPTAIAFAVSLRLDLDATQALLATAGFTLSGSKVFDQIIRYFILHQNYDIFEINEALFEFDQVLLGGF